MFHQLTGLGGVPQGRFHLSVRQNRLHGSNLLFCLFRTGHFFQYGLDLIHFQNFFHVSHFFVNLAFHFQKRVAPCAFAHACGSRAAASECASALVRLVPSRKKPQKAAGGAVFFCGFGCSFDGGYHLPGNIEKIRTAIFSVYNVKRKSTAKTAMLS